MGSHQTTTLTDADVVIPPSHKIHGLPKKFMVVGGIALLATFGMGAMDLGHFYYSYLTAFMFWLTIAAGGLFFVSVHHAVRAGWSTVVRRLAENFMGNLPMMGLLFIPVAMGLFVPGTHGTEETWLYHWTHVSADPSSPLYDPIVVGKSGYLNIPFFLIRALFVFGIWAFLAKYFRSRSVAQDKSGDQALTMSMQTMAPGAAALFGLTLTIGAVDWMMTLDPHWYSTIFGVYYLAGCIICINASLALCSMWLQRNGVLTEAITTEHYHDLGKYVWAFTIFWTYIAFSQFMLIWYANIPEETMWYGYRTGGTWLYVTFFLAIGHFILPFFFLMSRNVKRHRTGLALGCGWMLFIHWVDMYWLIQPVMTHHHHSYDAPFHLMDVTAFIGIGGLFVGNFLRQLCADAVIPHRDPRIKESLAFENF